MKIRFISNMRAVLTRRRWFGLGRTETATVYRIVVGGHWRFMINGTPDPDFKSDKEVDRVSQIRLDRTARGSIWQEVRALPAVRVVERCGNSVRPPVVVAIARSVMRAVGSAP